MPGKEPSKKLTLSVTEAQAAELADTANDLGITTTELLRRAGNLGVFLVRFYDNHPEADDCRVTEDDMTYVLPLKTILGVSTSSPPEIGD